MAASKLPDIGFLRECLDYDPVTGIFTWLERPMEHFPNVRIGRSWNGRFAGKLAGSMARTSRTRTYWMLAFGPTGEFKAHRIAWLWVYGEPIPELIDHINGDPLDNRIANLRKADKSANGMNQRISSRNTSGNKGVFRHAIRYADKPYVAYISVRGKRHHLGYFATEEEAVEARREAAVRLHGEFARHE